MERTSGSFSHEDCQFFVSDFFEISKTGWFFHSEFLKIPRIDDSLIENTENQWFFEKSKNCATHFLFVLFVFGCVCVCGGGKGERNVVVLLVLLCVKYLTYFVQCMLFIECLQDSAKFCKALSKNASWAVIVLVAKRSPDFSIELGLSSSKL